MPPLTAAERDEFLNQPGVLCRIATIRPDGGPTVTPIWFIHEDDAIYVTPRQNSAWLENIRRDPRISISIDTESAGYAKVMVEGVCEIVHEIGEDDVWRDLYRRIARRYVPAEGAEHYVQETIDQPRALIKLPLATSEVTSWRMPAAGESFTGIWHRRYYVEGSKMAAQSDAGQ